jgi:HEAT repeat protein
MRPLAALPLAVLAVLGLTSFAGCMQQGEERFKANPSTSEDPAEREIRLDIATLAKGGLPADPDSSVAYDRAINNLILRGAKIETRLIDALRSDLDPWVRVGCVEVLTAVATKSSVEHLIAVLDDETPLVAQRANIALQTLTGQRMIAEAAKPAPALLPAPPARAANDVELDAEERIWAVWHAQHKTELKAAWEHWWAANRITFTLK